MPDQAICETCGATGTIGEGIRTLNELGVGPGHQAHAIHLCEDCLERKDTRSWELTDALGRRLYETLEAQTEAPARRYSYLLEPGERIHLVRLRPDWVQRHALEA